MTDGSIVIDISERCDRAICDDLLEHNVVIAALGLRPSPKGRMESIRRELRSRSEWRADMDVVLTNFAVDGSGCICPHESVDDADNVDYFDVIFFAGPDAVSVDGVKQAVELLALEWRANGKPPRYHTRFDYHAD